MQGKLEELEEEQAQIERFKKLKEETILTLENPLSNNKAMRICEQCGALQGFNESEYKIQTHVLGKVHNGLIILRKEIEELRRRKDKLQIYLETQKEKQGEEKKKLRRERSRSRSKGKKNKEKKKEHKHYKQEYKKH